MNKIFSFFFIITTSFLFAQGKKMSQSEIQLLQQNVQKTATKTKTVISNFVQKKHLDFLANDITTYGKLAFKSPNLVKWEYTKPYRYSVVFKEENLLVNDGGKKNTINIGSSELFKRMNKLIVKSISGDMFDDDEFTISYIKNATAYVVNFSTKNADFKKFISQFVLHFSPKTYEVTQVKMIEPSGDYTTIQFKNRIQNSPLSDEIFTHK